MLDTLRRIILKVNAAPNLQEALRIIVTQIKAAMGVDVCSVYLADLVRGQYVLMATEGYHQQAVRRVTLDFGKGLVSMVAEREEPMNLEDAASHPRYALALETGEDLYRGFLGVPIIQHRKVLGVLVIRKREACKFSEDDETFLVTLAAQLSGAISHADASGEIDELLQDRGSERYNLKGLPGAPGVALGRARVIYPAADLKSIPNREIQDVEGEVTRFRAAVLAVQEELRSLSAVLASQLPREDLALFDALVLMLGSDSLVNNTVARIQAGNWAQGALRDTIIEHVALFENVDDAYMRERASDVRDLGQRLLTQLQPAGAEPETYYPRTILVGEEISAGQLAELPSGALVGVVSARGSSTSHVAILARALGIPAVMGVEDLPVGRLEGQELIADGYWGRVFVRPSATVREEFQRLEREEAELTADLYTQVHLLAETPDGVRVPLLANTGLRSDIAPSLRSGAEGVGLYRTEVPFMIRDRFPGEEDQRRIYRHVLEAFAPRPVTLRTLDVGGDKALSYFPIQEDNPFLGWRGIRISLDHPEIFLAQLRAIMKASAGLQNARLLLPMISGVAEVDAALGLIRRAFNEVVEEGADLRMPEVGVMIEVPSAVYQVEGLAQRVDFLSVGTNDLTQYLLAVDRNNARVAPLFDTLHPAVIGALRQVVEGAHRHGKPVSVCGEMAGDPAAALLLLGLGVDSLSMSAASLPRVKWVIRSFRQDHARKLLEELSGYEDPVAIRARLNDELEQAGLGGLVRPGK
jgi:phosphotransferase system enzyme I (PtsP)